MIGFSNIFHSWPKVSPRQIANAMTASRAVSIINQSYSDDSSRSSISSVSPKSCWQPCFFVMIARSVSVTGLRVVGSKISAGPQTFRVAAIFLLISVTVALFYFSVSISSWPKMRVLSIWSVAKSETESFSRQLCITHLSELGLTKFVSSY